MGTNFYAKKAISNEQHAKLSEALESKQYSTLAQLLEKYNVKHHIGKRSNGWQFLFNGYKTPWTESLESIQEYLKRPDVTIEDEYGNAFTYQEFFEQEINDCIYSDENHWNLKSYYNTHPQESPVYTNEHIAGDETRWSRDTEFF